MIILLKNSAKLYFHNHLIQVIIVIFILLLYTPVHAHNKVIVVPLFSSNISHLKNIITVAKANGDFMDPVVAVASINDASEVNPYLIVIAPGVYLLSEAIVMKDYVNITGSGKNVTELKGAFSSGERNQSSATIQLSSYSTLSNLTVKNTGGNNYSIGVYVQGFHPCYIENVNISALGATNNYGIYNSSYAEISNVFITVSGGAFGYGIYNNPIFNSILADVSISVLNTENAIGIVNDDSSPTMSDITIKVDGTTYSCGVSNTGQHSTPTLSNVSVTAEGDAETQEVYGVRNRDWSHSIMTDVSVTASGGNTSYGVLNSTNSGATIRRSTLSGDTYGIVQTGQNFGGSNISQSTIKNGVNGGGLKKCVFCDNGHGSALDLSCN